MPDTAIPFEAPPSKAPPGDKPSAEGPPRRGRKGWWVLLLLLAAGGAGAWWYWPRLVSLVQPAATEAAPRPGRGGRFQGTVPVTAVAATRMDIPLMLDALGSVQAYNSITIRSQVEGVLIEIAFTEGQEVRAGDVLARIDPRTYAAALQQAEAKRAQDAAILANSRLDLQRYTDLVRSNGASRQQLDTQRALVAQNEAQLLADDAAIAAARTQVEFTTIRSPVDGRVGIRLVDQGNLVRAGDANGIVVVNQMTPISVTLTLPQQELPRVLAAMREGPLPVRVMAPDGTVRAEGVVLTPDNQVDATTGTIRLKATFPNEDRALWPGAFVNLRLQVGTLRRALSVPVVAIQRGPDGPYAFVVKEDDTVEQRPLTLGLVTATEAVVQRGLEPGERVVTSGGLRLSAGSRVAVTEPVRPPPGGGPGGGRGQRIPRATPQPGGAPAPSAAPSTAPGR